MCKTLLVPSVTEEIQGLDPGRSDLVELMREGLWLPQATLHRRVDSVSRILWEWRGHVMVRTCYSKSTSTIFHFSSNASPSQYLETLCDLLYDDLRPWILHEPRLTVLCEVCTVLQALMVLDAWSTPSTSASAASSDADGSDSSDDDDDNLTLAQGPTRTSWDLTSNPPSSPSQRCHNRVGKRLHISHLFKMVLQDAQTGHISLYNAFYPHFRGHVQLILFQLCLTIIWLQ